MDIDILYIAHGRAEFTEATLCNLIQQTPWDTVNEFVVYHDAANSAADGAETAAILTRELADTEHVFRQTNLQSPVAVMNHYLWRAKADGFVKIDNDIIVPPYWFEALAGVVERDPELMLLGMEAGFSAVRYAEPRPECYTWTPSSHIGGVGFMRRDVFHTYPWPRPNGRFGFTEWQHRYQPTRGWLEPDIPLFSLDRLPVEPWRSITQRYLSLGLNRAVSSTAYPKEMRHYWDWFTGGAPLALDLDEEDVDGETWGMMQS